MSVIWDASEQENLVTAETPAILSGAEYRDFWISWHHNMDGSLNMLVGKGKMFSDVFMNFTSDKPHGINSVSLSTTEMSFGYWRFQDDAGMLSILIIATFSTTFKL